MLSQGPFQLQHFMIMQLLISVLMSFIYKENATDTPPVGACAPSCFSSYADGSAVLHPYVCPHPLCLPQFSCKKACPVASAGLWSRSESAIL